MNAHERTLLQHHASRHERLIREAELYRALRGRPATGFARRLRLRTASALRNLAARLESVDDGRLASAAAL